MGIGSFKERNYSTTLKINLFNLYELKTPYNMAHIIWGFQLILYGGFSSIIWAISFIFILEH